VLLCCHVRLVSLCFRSRIGVSPHGGWRPDRVRGGPIGTRLAPVRGVVCVRVDRARAAASIASRPARCRRSRPRRGLVFRRGSSLCRPLRYRCRPRSGGMCPAGPERVVLPSTGRRR
jgi:hypothetical protein